MEYSKDELMQCIFDCIEESLSDGWGKAKLSASVLGNEISSEFRYVINNQLEEIDFIPDNLTAPLNACREYLKIICSEGSLVNHIEIEMTASGSMNVVCSKK